MDRNIAHMDLDSFFVSVEVLRNSGFKNKPVIIGGSSQRGVVASCSYEARKFGVRSAMPMRMALSLCPDAIVIKGDMELYSRYSSLVTEIIREKAPVFEKASIDEFYLDLTGMDRFFGAYKWMSELRSFIIKESGLPISFATSVNKTVSKIGTGEVKPNGEIFIPQGNEKAYIAPLSVARIPMIGDKTYKLLAGMGVRYIKTLADLPPQLMERQFGKSGLQIWEKANAIDRAPVQPYSEQKSISSERTFQTDTTDLMFLDSVLLRMTEKLGFELRSQNKLCSCITLKIRYSDFNTETKQLSIPYTSSDHVILKHVRELFKKLYNKRLLIRLVGIRLSSLVHGNQQINLFEDTPLLISLYQALDKVKNRYGEKAVMRAGGLDHSRND